MQKIEEYKQKLNEQIEQNRVLPIANELMKNGDTDEIKHKDTQMAEEEMTSILRGVATDVFGTKTVKLNNYVEFHNRNIDDMRS